MMKEDWTPIDFGQTEDTTKNIIKVIGVGGGGCNAVKNMYSEGIVNVSFAVCNTDSQSLSKSPVPVKIMLGKSGLGAGANPEVGRSEAQNTQEDIKRLLDDGTKMAFVTAGMGGGTGTGAAPVIAGIAKSMGILTVGIITIPFYFEKRKKIVKALQGVEEMRKNVDALLIVNNERLCDVYADSEITVKDAFKLADKVLSDATKSISELITVEGTSILTSATLRLPSRAAAVLSWPWVGPAEKAEFRMPFSMPWIPHCSTAATSAMHSASSSTSIPPASTLSSLGKCER